MRVQAAPPEHFQWLTQRCGLLVTPGFRAIEAVDRRGRILGMVGYDNWLPNSVEMHFAIDEPIACRSLLRPAFEYPFNECGRNIALGFVPESNRKSLRMAKHLGFRELYRIEDGWMPRKDMVVLILRKQDCRWLEAQRRAA